MKYMAARSSGCRVRIFPLLGYVEEALNRAEYITDENGVVIGRVPEAPGFFAEGKTRREGEENLRDVIEGNILLALQLGFDIPPLPGIDIQYVETDTGSGRIRSSGNSAPWDLSGRFRE